MYDIRPPPTGREAITIGGEHRLQVEYIGSVVIEFHGYTKVRMTLTNVSYIPGLGRRCQHVFRACSFQDWPGSFRFTRSPHHRT